ncbi:fam-a protein [Plasmodium chabaudi chabaudi]|uniref:Fam-a protein n=1 Tax=Plasmodium chabaudi chabaudi TaxID=31271 RepID=A0A1D3L954_PLACU|nr:fam-a protein [Plasmodium chabaudi chabaudi]
MNKVYIKIVLALLSLAGYMENIAFASETDEKCTMKPCGLRQKDVMEEYKDKECEDTDETLQVAEYAQDASVLLMKLSETGVESYSLDSKKSENENIYSKKIGNVDIGRLELTIPSSSKYIDILRKIWDFKDHQKKDNKFIDGKVVRIYCKYCVLFEKQINSQKRYAIGARIRKTDDKTVIVSPTRAIKYDGEINQETDLKKIFENEKSIEADIDPEEALTKLGDNIAGFVVKRDDDQVHITYINAIVEGDNYTTDKKNRDITYKNILSIPQQI